MQFVVYVNTLTEYLWEQEQVCDEVCTIFLLWTVLYADKQQKIVNKISVLHSLCVWLEHLISASCNMWNEHKSKDLRIKYSLTDKRRQRHNNMTAWLYDVRWKNILESIQTNWCIHCNDAVVIPYTFLLAIVCNKNTFSYVIK